MEPSGDLLHNLVLFGRLLRGLGLDVNPGRMIDLVQALAYIDLSRKEDVYHTMRCLIVRCRADIPLFDEAFDAFWRLHPEGLVTFNLSVLAESRRARRPRFVPPPLKPPAKSPAGPDGQERRSPDEQPVIQVVRTYSDREVLRHKDFAELSGEELEAIQRLMAALVWQLGSRRSRRREPGHGQLVDLRRTLRRNLRYGGEVLSWAYRRPKLKQRPLVILADISGSMERYTRLLLHFIYSLSGGLQQHVEAFVFSTRLTRITRQLLGRDLEAALDQVTRVVPDWSGGTRIGDALKTFNFEWSRRVLGQGAVVLLISDGWDRGDPDLLRAEIARLQRSCYRLIWLNPLLGSEQYEPLTRGMQAALPHIDDFLPVHNLASLEDLAQHLQLAGRCRPTRPQSRIKQDRLDKQI